MPRLSLRAALDGDATDTDERRDLDAVYGTYHPFFARGDLDGDARLDFVQAFLEKGRSGPWFHVAVVLREARRYVREARLGGARDLARGRRRDRGAQPRRHHARPRGRPVAPLALGARRARLRRPRRRARARGNERRRRAGRRRPSRSRGRESDAPRRPPPPEPLPGPAVLPPAGRRGRRRRRGPRRGSVRKRARDRSRRGSRPAAGSGRHGRSATSWRFSKTSRSSRRRS